MARKVRSAASAAAYRRTRVDSWEPQLCALGGGGDGVGRGGGLGGRPVRAAVPRLAGRTEDVLAVGGRGGVLPRPVAAALVLEGFEGLGPLGEAEVAEGFPGRPVVGDAPARGQDQQPVADVEAEDAVGDHDDGAAVVGEASQHVHHRAVHARVEAGGGLVQEEQGGFGEELQGDGHPFALAAGEAVDGLGGALVEAEFADHLVHPPPAFGLRGVLREAQFGGVHEGAPDGELGVEDVVLRHEPDAAAQFGVVAVEVAAVVEDGPPVGGAQAGEGAEQGGLAGSAGADDGEQAFGAHGEGHLVEEGLAAAVDGDGEALDVEGDLARVLVLLEPVADEAEGQVADADDVALGEGDRARDGGAVEVGAVVAAEVGDLVAAVGEGPQFGVPARYVELVDHEVVVDGAADAHGGAGGQREDGAGLPEGGGHRRVGDPGRPGSGRRGPGPRSGEDGPRAVLRVAEAQFAAGADAPLVDAVAVGPGAVGAVLVLDRPVVAVGAQDRVVPGDAGVLEADLAVGVPADVVRPARAHRCGARRCFQDELWRGRHTGALDHEQIFPRSHQPGSGPTKPQVSGLL